MKNPLHKLHKRAFTLLEVLISFALVTLCVIPLIYPLRYIYVETQQYIHEVQLDRQVLAIYAHLLNRLYRQEIPWEDIENRTPFEFDDRILELPELKGPPKFPWLGNYHFEEEISKDDGNGKDELYRLNLVFIFHPLIKERNEKEAISFRRYSFPFLLLRTTGETTTEENQQETEQASEEEVPVNPRKKGFEP